MPFPFRPVPALRPAAIGLAFAALASAGAAADKKPAPPPAAAKTAILTPAQLRECVTQKEKLGKDTDAALKAKAAMDADKAQIDRSGKALEDEATTLDRTSADAVAAYNVKVGERNGLIEAYQAKVASYNTQAENVLAAKDAYEKACADRRYDDRDLLDIQRKK
jgi:hypothetical protein